MQNCSHSAASLIRLRHAVLAFVVWCAALAAPSLAADYLDRPPEDEVVYFVLPDRFENADPGNDLGGLDGGRLDHGFDQTDKGFFHGGDLKGLTARLDYIEGLGVTAIWLGPIYKNKPVQGPLGDESAGYHGYWITDFTSVDPHFGTNDDLKEFVDAAHQRSIKVYLDIITNHTADVILYRECHDPDYQGADKPEQGCPYRSKADYPYSTRGLASGERINDGFMSDDPLYQTKENFEHLTRDDYAYTPYVPAGEENVKKPDWLNDPRYYHNRGDSFWFGESALYGDFSGLDDLLTEDPRVVEGFIEIFKDWITNYKIDGFRIDTARHVNPEFWQTFSAAMLEHATAQGIPNFYIFGEAYSPNPAGLARFTRVDGLPYVLDFAFQSTVQEVVLKGAPAIRFQELFDVDALYEGGGKTTAGLPVFIGNHDMGRFSMFARQALPDASEEEISKRVLLAHAMMFYLRGVPVIYYGDEQGFISDGNDKAAREDMFPSLVDSFNDNDLLGTDDTTASANFNTKHPFYRALSKMARIYSKHAPLRHSAQLLRVAEHEGSLMAVSRLGEDGGEYLIIFNAANHKRTLQINVDPRSTSWKSISGRCNRKSTTIGSVQVTTPPLAYVICKSNDWN